MADSDFTKKIRRLYWLYRILDIACLAAPVFVYALIGLFSGQTLIGGRIALAFSFVIVIMMTVLNAVAKLRLRSPVWITILGLYIAMRDRLLPLVIILALTSALSDFVFHPLAKKYEARLSASRTIDSRMDEIDQRIDERTKGNG